MRMIASAATLLAAATLLCACQPKAAPPPATTAETQVTTEEDKALYALGALISQNLPVYSLYSQLGIYTWVSSLQGPTLAKQVSGYSETVDSTTPYWNIHEWTAS